MRRTFLIFISFIFLFSACSVNGFPIDERELTTLAWQAIEPNTSSHDRNAWEVVELRSVKGEEIQEIFEGEPVPGNCVPGPLPPEDKKIQASASYWYVRMKPVPVTSEPIPTEQYSPTAPPRIPEPFLRDAHLLIDPGSGEIVARKLYCVIY